MTPTLPRLISNRPIFYRGVIRYFAPISSKVGNDPALQQQCDLIRGEVRSSRTAVVSSPGKTGPGRPGPARVSENWPGAAVPRIVPTAGCSTDTTAALVATCSSAISSGVAEQRAAEDVGSVEDPDPLCGGAGAKHRLEHRGEVTPSPPPASRSFRSEGPLASSGIPIARESAAQRVGV